MIPIWKFAYLEIVIGIEIKIENFQLIESGLKIRNSENCNLESKLKLKIPIGKEIKCENSQLFSKHQRWQWKCDVRVMLVFVKPEIYWNSTIRREPS